MECLRILFLAYNQNYGLIIEAIYDANNQGCLTNSIHQCQLFSRYRNSHLKLVYNVIQQKQSQLNTKNIFLCTRNIYFTTMIHLSHVSPIKTSVNCHEREYIFHTNGINKLLKILFLKAFYVY